MMAHKKLLNEITRSTLLTCSLFMLFDVFIQGYQPYHLLALSAVTLLGATSIYLRKRFLYIEHK
ncbi:hypothetical protein PCNPT3_00340 [Psychromonas sp. CNPT3]|uniref:hypothetical protein n=1 Tax=Psychromonas sp. CNPT3 TaxID=314282 RepID=UPI00006E50BA|nr:hypothetical protein [Psychromonas sp. CNPT3]AGH80010.1 hypothetical protein PCNPT3_00340 [Psychromonas sp. CNPT3]